MMRNINVKYTFSCYRMVFLSLALMLLYQACKDPYKIPLKAGAENVLIVEGYLNSTGQTTIKLSRSVEMISQYNSAPELKAVLQIESENNQTYPLIEEGAGLYSRILTNYPEDQKYRLKIQTKDGLVYYSEYVDLKKTPPIQDVVWEKNEDGVGIFVNTRDPDNRTRYYKWDWEETWRFETDLKPTITLLGKSDFQSIDSLPRYPFHGNCWQSEKSNDILIASTEKLTDDVISKRPLAFIPNGSWKMGVHYSINVKQHAISKDSYAYWENIRKNSSDLGGIASPMPSEIIGNMYCASDENQKVIGFFDASSGVEKRIFIKRSDLVTWSYRDNCELRTIPNYTDSIYFFIYLSGNYLVDVLDVSESRLSFASPRCVDCSVRGTPVKPSYWPD
jgi:hypothetical protein